MIVSAYSHSFAQRLQDEERGQLVHKPRQIQCNSHWSCTTVDNHLRSLDKNQCQLCGKIFRRVSDVKIHERVHSGERPYHCHFCGNKFKQQGHLRTHIRIHTGEKPFICPKCGRRFKDPSVKNKHVKRCKVYTGKWWKLRTIAKCLCTFLYFIVLTCLSFNIANYGQHFTTLIL